ncbi:hypothetical protein V6Z12_D13G155000 [Gossypium hirsutum]
MIEITETQENKEGIWGKCLTNFFSVRHFPYLSSSSRASPSSICATSSLRKSPGPVFCFCSFMEDQCSFMEDQTFKGSFRSAIWYLWEQGC